MGFAENINGFCIHTYLRAWEIDRSDTPYVTTVCPRGTLQELVHVKYAEREDALVGHVDWVKRVKAGELSAVQKQAA